jgi:hypothetical protein
VPRSLLALLVPLCLAGCGGGDGDGDRMSAGDYRQQADRICADANTKLRKLGEPQSVAEFRELAKKAKPIIGEGVADLNDLNPPKQLQGAHDRWIDLNEQLVDDLDEVQDTTTQADLTQFAQKFGVRTDEANRIARSELGLEDCGEE